MWRLYSSNSTFHSWLRLISVKNMRRLLSSCSGYLLIQSVYAQSPILAWLILALIDVYFALVSTETSQAGAVEATNVVMATAAIKTWLWLTLINFNLTRDPCIKKKSNQSNPGVTRSWDYRYTDWREKLLCGVSQCLDLAFIIHKGFCKTAHKINQTASTNFKGTNSVEYDLIFEDNFILLNIHNPWLFMFNNDLKNVLYRTQVILHVCSKNIIPFHSSVSYLILIYVLFSVYWTWVVFSLVLSHLTGKPRGTEAGISAHSVQTDASVLARLWNTLIHINLTVIPLETRHTEAWVAVPTGSAQRSVLARVWGALVQWRRQLVSWCTYKQSTKGG